MDTILPDFRKRVPLIVDADTKFLDTITRDPKAEELPPIVTDSGKQAQLYLADTSLLISCIFISRNLQNNFSFSIVRFAHRYRPAVPIYFTTDDTTEPLDPNKLHLLGVQSEVKKPLTYPKMLTLLKPIALTFDAATALDKALKIQSDNEEAVETDEQAFVPIFAQNFVSGTTSFFDIYVKLSSGRFVKILKSGDSFTPERIDGYLKKGLTYFYIRKEIQEIYLSYCERLTTQIVKSGKPQPLTQVTQILNHGQEVMSFLGTNGLSAPTLKYASNFISNVHDLVHKMKKETNSNPYMSSFLENLPSYEHGMSVSIVGSILGSAMGIDSSDPVHVLGLACLMHDIGLMPLPDLVKEEDITKMPEDLLDAYYNHPQAGANMLKTMRNINPTTIQAVLQHHERKDKLGFPNHLGVGSINRISEIVGISDEFVRLVKKANSDPKFDPFLAMEGLLFKSFSFPVSDIFRRVFIEKQEGEKLLLP